jgi:hypothetical protein
MTLTDDGQTRHSDDKKEQGVLHAVKGKNNDN